MSKEYIIMLVEPQINNRPLYNAIHGQRAFADALVVAFVGNAETDFNELCQMYSQFYDEDDVHFVGVEGDIKAVNDDLIYSILDTIKEQNIPVDGFGLSSVVYQSNETESEEV